MSKKELQKIFNTKMRLFGEFLVNESRTRGRLSIPRQGFNRLVQSCPIVYMIIITQTAYVMARAYRYCLLILKQCTCGLVYSRNSSDFLGSI